MMKTAARLRAFKPWLRHMALLGLLALSTEAAAARSVAPLVVGSDRGGYIGERAMEVAGLVATGRRVEIRGPVCYSSCTMYLGATDVCVAPKAIFGFHGPSWFGRALPVSEFEHWSQLMAAHYREPLRSWFMQTGRYRKSDYFRISGAELIRMGYTPC